MVADGVGIMEVLAVRRKLSGCPGLVADGVGIRRGLVGME